VQQFSEVTTRLSRDAHNRLVAIVSGAGGTLPAGTVLRVLGNEIAAGAPAVFQFTGAVTGRVSRAQPVKRRTVEQPREITCVECGQRYTVSARNARNGSSRCAVCRGIPEPELPPRQELFEYWTSRYSPQELAELAAPFA
jgi:hypothetical protein